MGVSRNDIVETCLAEAFDGEVPQERAHDDLRECRAKDTLARCGGCSGMQPGALQISTERHQLLALRLAERRRTTRNQGGDLSFDPCDSLQCLVPAALQLAGDQPVCRVDGVVPSARMRGFVAWISELPWR